MLYMGNARHYVPQTASIIDAYFKRLTQRKNQQTSTNSSNETCPSHDVLFSLAARSLVHAAQVPEQM